MHICVNCRKKMKPEKNGVYFLEYAHFGPYKLWHSDKWKCPTCGYEILAGFGFSPVRQHFDEDFTECCNRAEELIEEAI